LHDAWAATKIQKNYQDYHIEIKSGAMLKTRKIVKKDI
jgi:hypothetical protein